MELTYPELIEYFFKKTHFSYITTLAKELDVSVKTMQRLIAGQEPGDTVKRKIRIFADKHLGVTIKEADNSRVVLEKNANYKSILNSTGTNVTGDSNVISSSDLLQKYIDLQEKYIKLLEQQKD